MFEFLSHQLGKARGTIAIDNNINNYTPNVSVSQSGVAYAGNRVQSLKLKEIRLTLDDGTTLTDNTVRVAHQLIQ